MSQKEQLLKLFPQPVFKYQINDYKSQNNELIKYIYELHEKDSNGVKKSNINGWHSKSFDLSDKNSTPNNFFFTYFHTYHGCF